MDTNIYTELELALLNVYVLGMPTPPMIALYKYIKVTIYVYDKVSVYASHLFYSGKLVKIEPHYFNYNVE